MDSRPRLRGGRLFAGMTEVEDLGFLAAWCNGGSGIAARPFQGKAVVGLQSRPDVRRDPEHTFELQCGARREGLASKHDAVDGLHGPSHRPCQLPLAHAPGRELVPQRRAGRDRLRRRENPERGVSPRGGTPPPAPSPPSSSSRNETAADGSGARSSTTESRMVCCLCRAATCRNFHSFSTNDLHSEHKR